MSRFRFVVIGDDATRLGWEGRVSKPTARAICAELATLPVAEEAAGLGYDLASRVRPVLALHYEGDTWCEECGHDWPCNTIRALNGEAE
jgi:hypothetical protein